MRRQVLLSALLSAVVNGSALAPEISEKEIKRVQAAQHTLDVEVAQFRKNLEGLKTTVEFPMGTV
jgi:hypothetical protein